MTNEDLQRRLSCLKAVFTPRLGVRNDIVRVAPDSVVVRSARTGRTRRISFEDIRNATQVSRNGVVARTLLAAVTRRSRSSLALASRKKTRDSAGLVAWYRKARAWTRRNSDWVSTIAWTRDPANLTAQAFLREYAWAVYASGFRAWIVQSKWQYLRKA